MMMSPICMYNTTRGQTVLLFTGDTHCEIDVSTLVV